MASLPRIASAMTPETTLRAVKLVHTAVWAVFAGAIVVIPFATWHGDHRLAWGLIAFTGLEVVVLVANRLRCPLTDVAARYTSDRADNFDIYLPRWLARHNKQIFGTWYLAGIGYALWASWTSHP